MRLYPPVTQEEAHAWLTARATEDLGQEAVDALATDLAPLAEAMAIISSIELPDDLEPLFP